MVSKLRFREASKMPSFSTNKQILLSGMIKSLWLISPKLVARTVLYIKQSTIDYDLHDLHDFFTSMFTFTLSYAGKHIDASNNSFCDGKTLDCILDMIASCFHENCIYMLTQFLIHFS